MRLAGTPMQLASCVAPGKLDEPLPPLPFSFFHPLGMSERTRSIFLACALLDAALAPAPATWVPRVRPTASSTVTITLAARTFGHPHTGRPHTGRAQPARSASIRHETSSRGVSGAAFAG